MLSTRRKPFPIGASKGVTLPAAMKILDEVSMAAGDRLILMDTTGEVPEDKLLQFFMEYVQPAFERWWGSQRQPKPSAKRGAFTPQQAESTTPTKGKPVTGPPGFLPGPLIYEVLCPRCGRRFGWDVAIGGKQLYCLYCGMPIELML